MLPVYLALILTCELQVTRNRSVPCLLCRAAGAVTISSVSAEIRASDVGTRAGLFEVQKIGDEFFAFVVDCDKPKACSIVLRGASKVLVALLLCLHTFCMLQICVHCSSRLCMLSCFVVLTQSWSEAAQVTARLYKQQRPCLNSIKFEP